MSVEIKPGFYWVRDEFNDHQPVVAFYNAVYNEWFPANNALAPMGRGCGLSYLENNQIIGPAVCFEAFTEKYPALKSAYDHLMVVWKMCEAEE